MKKLFTIAYDNYLCASNQNDGLGDSVEGICLYSEDQNTYPDMIVALDKEGIETFLQSKGITDWDGRDISLEILVADMDLYVGVYNFTESRIDVVGSLRDVQSYIDLVKYKYADHANLRPVEVQELNNFDNYYEVFDELQELFQDQSFKKELYRNVLAKYDILDNDITRDTLKTLYEVRIVKRMNEIKSIISDEAYPEGSEEDVLACEFQDLQVPSLQFENMLYYFKN